MNQADVAKAMMMTATKEGTERIDQVVRVLEQAAEEIRRHRGWYERAVAQPDAISNSACSAEQALGAVINHMAGNVMFNARLDLLADSMAKIAAARELVNAANAE